MYIWKWLWNSQNFGCWVFSCSNHPQNGYPNFEAIWRLFTEIGHHEHRAYNETNEIMIAERSDLLDLHYKLESHDDRSRWTKHLRLIFYSKTIHHKMCFRTHPGSPLENPLYIELQKIIFWLHFQHTSAFCFQLKKSQRFLGRFPFFSLNWREKSTLQTQLASTQRFSKPALKIKQVLVRYHHIIFYPINFLLPQNIKKNLQIWYEPVFFGSENSPSFLHFFWNANGWDFWKKNVFQEKTPGWQTWQISRCENWAFWL